MSSPSVRLSVNSKLQYFFLIKKNKVIEPPRNSIDRMKITSGSTSPSDTLLCPLDHWHSS